LTEGYKSKLQGNPITDIQIVRNLYTIYKIKSSGFRLKHPKILQFLNIFLTQESKHGRD